MKIAFVSTEWQEQAFFKQQLSEHELEFKESIEKVSADIEILDAFAKCRKGVIVINTARGALIDTDALIEALDAGIVAGAGLDVLEGELATFRGSPEELKKQINQVAERNESLEENRLKRPEKIRELQALAKNKALIERANVIFTPHVAFNSVEALRRISVTTSKNIKSFVDGSPSNLIRR